MSKPGLGARVGRQTALYGIGILAGKVMSFLALPIYTRLLTPADYGVIQLVEMTFDMLTIIAGSRLANGIFRFFHKTDSEAERHAVLTTALLLVGATFSVVAVATWFAADVISQAIFGSSSYGLVIRIAALSFPWTGILGVPLGFLQLTDRAGIFVSVGLLKSVLSLGGVLVFLAYFEMGVPGVFVSTLIANTLVGTGLLVLLIRQTGLHFSGSAARDLLRFGLPLVITQIATFATTFGDRYFLQRSMGEEEVGIYALAYNFGFLLFTVGFTPFGQVWGPVRFEAAKREDRHRIFNRSFINMNLLLVTAAVGIGVYVDDLLRIMSDPEFWRATVFVPVILIAYILQGWSAFLDTGILVAERTKYVTYGNWWAAGVALTGYVFLIPPYGGWGAAWATVAAFALRAYLIHHYSQRLWPISYNWRPVWLLIFIGTATVAVSEVLPTMSLLQSLSARTGLVVVYLAAVWLAGIIPEEEVRTVREVVSSPQLALKRLGLRS